MGKRIVIALGGNALGKNLPEQMEAVRRTAKPIADLIEQGHEVVISHGNGPQVGMINIAMTHYARENPGNTIPPMSVCTAMSQGYIGYDLQNALREELLNRNLHRGVSTVLTQIAVDPADLAFQHPTKPIGPFMTREEALRLEAQGKSVMEDAGRGWRRCVASPMPRSIIEIGAIRALLAAGQIVIACGGGGIPVFPEEHHHLRGAGAVIDKDFAAALLAEELNADLLLILTTVEKVSIHFGGPNEEPLEELTPDLARKYIADGEFAPGSMLPKVQAAVKFAESGENRTACITLLEKARDGMEGRTGTVIHR